MAESVTQALEAELAELSQRLAEPGEREWLRCFLKRKVGRFLAR